MSNTNSSTQKPVVEKQPIFYLQMDDGSSLPVYEILEDEDEDEDF